MRARRGAAAVVDLELNGLPHLEPALLHNAVMDEEAAELLLRILDGEMGAA